MKKIIALFAITGVFTVGNALASGWRIPEQSVNSTALSSAYVAHAHGADAAYFNPANMSFEEDKEKWQLEVDAMYIHLTSVDFTHLTTPAYDGDSNNENFLLPLFHLVSPEFKNMRVGLSFTVPGGLSKRWDDSYPKASAGEFSLKIMELNPTISYKLHDKVSVAGGLRAVYSEGKVFSDYAGVLLRELEGDAIDYGYNIALTINPTDKLSTALTWRSKVDLNLEGDAILKYTPVPALTYTGGGKVSVPLPGVLTAAMAYTIQSTTVEIAWDRTFWSEYEELDFSYDQSFTVSPYDVFDAPVSKDFDDTNAFRIGVTHKMLEDRLTLMAGFALDETPVPSKTLGFELPDSDAQIYSFGAKYKINDQYEIGMAYLYVDKDERTIAVADNNSIVGTFSNAAAHMVTTGLNVNF